MSREDPRRTKDGPAKTSEGPAKDLGCLRVFVGRSRVLCGFFAGGSLLVFAGRSLSFAGPSNGVLLCCGEGFLLSALAFIV